MQGTNALIEYSYLVKKWLYLRSVSCPLIKVISAVFVHVFFVAFTLVLFCCYGKFPDIYAIQLLYYSICAFALVLSMTYITSAVVVFFRDLTHLITILLQIGVWMTPIMWDFVDMGISENALVARILKLNPMYYIVSGYRNALVDKQWFWEHPGQTIYFWAVTVVLFLFGTRLFKKLKVHFADVL